MQIQVRHDATIQGSEKLDSLVAATLQGSLGRFDQITTVEVHFADENGAKKGGDDIRCTIEVRFAGLSPMAVTHHADDLIVALDVAAEKAASALDHQLAKIRDRHAPS